LIEKFTKVISENLYQIEHPKFGDTDCGSERIINAVVNITKEAFELAIATTGIKNEELRYFCGEDLLSRAINDINTNLNANLTLPNDLELKKFARSLTFYEDNKGLALLLFQKGIVTKKK
jgi:hypothetical protein